MCLNDRITVSLTGEIMIYVMETRSVHTDQTEAVNSALTRGAFANTLVTVLGSSVHMRSYLSAVMA